MARKYDINEKWIKASIIGTIWAASEIVLGSFLHNLRVPFSSNILTAIGIIILISSGYIWKEKGLFWRAGLICALMKTMSPSAVIFGPMIAIFSESVLMEISVRIFRRNVIGYTLGAMLAMSWNLFHKIMNFIIVYGFNIVDVYSELLTYARKQLGLHFDVVWLPILFLLGLFCILGFVSALIGIRIGRKLQQQPPEKNLERLVPAGRREPADKSRFGYSIGWLVSDVCLMISGLVLLNFMPWYIWSAAIAVIAFIWILRYKQALKQLSRPRFWLWFMLITMLAAFVFSRIRSNDLVTGIMIGIQMNFRAVLLILGFSVLGTELYNPEIRNFFLRTSFKQLPMALELSFESLPLMIAGIPEFKVMMKNPVSILYRLLSQVEFRLEEIRKNLSKRVFILSGCIGQGKTTRMQELAETLKSANIPVAGILSPRALENGATAGYDIVDISTGKREPFLRVLDDPGLERIGRYSILPAGLLAGMTTLALSESNGCRFILIDEIGRLELKDRGWARQLNELLFNTQSDLILSVRDSLTEQVIRKWNFRNYRVFDVSRSGHEQILDSLLQTAD